MSAGIVAQCEESATLGNSGQQRTDRTPTHQPTSLETLPVKPRQTARLPTYPPEPRQQPPQLSPNPHGRIEPYTPMAHNLYMIFRETSFFTKLLTSLFSDEEYQQMQAFLLRNPGQGKVIQGSGGIRKMEWRLGTHGKKGGIRVIYYWQVSAEQIYLLYLYPKNVQEDLTKEQLRNLRKLVELEFNQ